MELLACASVVVSNQNLLLFLSLLSSSLYQGWDKKNGLPKSHSQTMVNSGRSRKQLQKGVILKKWNGDPLIIAAKERAAEIAKAKKDQDPTADVSMSSEKQQAANDAQDDETMSSKSNLIIADVTISDNENKSGTASTDATIDSETMLGEKICDDDDNSKVDDEMSMDPNEIFGSDV